MSKLYPPYIEGTLPAFCIDYDDQGVEIEGATIVVPFSMNKAVGSSQIEGFILRLKTVQTGTFLFSPVFTDEYNLDQSTVTFSLTSAQAKLLNQGQYYKIQIAYCTSSVLENGVPEDSAIGYYSTVGVIKCISKPSITIENFDENETNLFSNYYLGIYDLNDCVDNTEKVYSYQFDFYDSDGILYYSTGEILHNASTDTDYNFSTDSLSINNFCKYGEMYTIVYTVTTLNGYTASSPSYKITSEEVLTAGSPIKPYPTNNYDNGYIAVSFKSVDEDDVYCYGRYILSRAEDTDNYQTWIDLNQFFLDNDEPSSIIFKDFNIEQGVIYKYAIQQYNMWNIYSDRIESDTIKADFEDMFLYDGDVQLRIQFNPKVTSFKIDILEQKTDTIGSKYPFFFRNGKVRYKEFPISGLISYLTDKQQLFFTREDYWFARPGTTTTKLTDDMGLYSDNQLTVGEAVELFSDGTNLTSDNFTLERRFKLKVLDWLNNGKPKIFKSPAEGNYLVRLLNISLAPQDTLGRMIHTFTSTAYEIGEINYTNLKKYNFIPDFENVSTYVVFEKSYDLYHDFDVGQDIDLKFDTSLTQIQLQDLIPGTQVYIKFSGDDEFSIIQIGTTGAYTATSDDKPIAEILIPGNQNYPINGSIHCIYSGTRVTEFDAITKIGLKSIAGHQFIGVNYQLYRWHELMTQKTTYSEGREVITEDQYEALTQSNFRDYANDLEWLNYGVYGITDTIIQALKDIEPGDVLSYINNTIYDGKIYKTKLLKLEQAKFTARPIEPLYVVSYKTQNINKLYETISITEASMTPFSTAPEEQDCEYNKNIVININELKDSFSSEKNNISSNSDLTLDEKDEQIATLEEEYNNQLIELIKQLNTNAMLLDKNSDGTVVLDNYVIYEIFVLQDNNWVPLTDVLGAYARYYDPQYKCLWQDIDFSFCIGDKQKYKILQTIDDEGNAVALSEKDQDILALQEIYSYDPDTNIYSITGDAEATLYFKQEDGSYIIAENSDDAYYVYDTSFSDPYILVQRYNLLFSRNANVYIPNLYYCKKINNSIDIQNYDGSYYKENLGEIDYLRIGNGIIADLTYELKYFDYYTESNEADVAAAKEAYITARDDLGYILNNYENIKTMDEQLAKNSALYYLYVILINGNSADSSHSFSEEELSIIKTYLQDELESTDGEYNEILSLISGNSIDGILREIELSKNLLDEIQAEQLENKKQIDADAEEQESLKEAFSDAVNNYNEKYRERLCYEYLKYLLSETSLTIKDIYDHYLLLLNSTLASDETAKQYGINKAISDYKSLLTDMQSIVKDIGVYQILIDTDSEDEELDIRLTEKMNNTKYNLFIDVCKAGRILSTLTTLGYDYRLNIFYSKLDSISDMVSGNTYYFQNSGTLYAYEYTGTLTKPFASMEDGWANSIIFYERNDELYLPNYSSYLSDNTYGQSAIKEYNTEYNTVVNEITQAQSLLETDVLSESEIAILQSALIDYDKIEIFYKYLKGTGYRYKNSYYDSYLVDSSGKEMMLTDTTNYSSKVKSISTYSSIKQQLINKLSTDQVVSYEEENYIYQNSTANLEDNKDNYKNFLFDPQFNSTLPTEEQIAEAKILAEIIISEILEIDSNSSSSNGEFSKENSVIIYTKNDEITNDELVKRIESILAPDSQPLEASDQKLLRIIHGDQSTSSITIGTTYYSKLNTLGFDSKINALNDLITQYKSELTADQYNELLEKNEKESTEKYQMPLLFDTYLFTDGYLYVQDNYAIPNGILNKEPYLYTIDEEIFNWMQTIIDYHNKLLSDTQESLDKLYSQALALYNIYINLNSDYQIKMNNYNTLKEQYDSSLNAEKTTSAYKFYEELKQNNDTQKSAAELLNQYRELIKETWKKFMIILDIEYTAEKERGMYK